MLPAWQSLDGNTRSVYVEIAQRYAGAGSNNGRIPYSIREAYSRFQRARWRLSHDFSPAYCRSASQDGRLRQ
jgi:hypothetical protein